MKNILINKIGIFFLAASTLFLSGCEGSIEGINSDPLAALDIDPALLMPQVLLGGITANRTVEQFQMSTHSQHWSFSAAFGVFVNPERGTVGPNTTNNIWVGNYTTGLRNLQQMRLLTEENNPSATNIIGQAKVLEAFIYLNLTQIFGSVPFSEAIQVNDFPNPNFDSQEDILRGIPDLIDEAIAALSSDTDIIGAPADLIYGGDRESWVRFGNSIKLKALMLIANVDPASVQTQLQEVASQPLITTNAFEAKLDYLDVAGNQNPIYTLIVQFAGGDQDFYSGGSTLISLMNNNNDPRRAAYFDEITSGGYVGQPQGEFLLDRDQFSQVSLDVIRPELPDRYITAPEVNFYLAEAALLGWISGDANAFYQAGVQASLGRYDGLANAVPQADKDTYMASARGSISGDSQADALRKIHEEHYVADFMRHMESWTTIRRNRVPAYEAIDGTVLTDNIRRYQVPLSELTSNPNAPDLVPFITPMFFEK
ncbi:SusD/RagB family nutrient-binding outer membrane lipoprotein [Aquimarina sp. MMG016]|uniref:SusD/RagB family nutrient-binding outer membrane lipoprotein n=1 Tax=Aquimarina sp. MMG016 TaxID=2822690 RepID=UPI001B3A39BC|nr:SusD/RagB family nutrient-binding outer membrane lipoprotein [Aquimarina sp. MMG016]MBQ4821466.1 SusD/RagB family nutrient-binding outer membrane lipoprotein [Aquimarina sp. MMG016]